MYVNINLTLINSFAGTQVFIDDYDTRLVFKDYGINAFISLFYQYTPDISVCCDCEEAEENCFRCNKNHVGHLMLQTDIRYIGDVVDVIEHETGVKRGIILHLARLTDIEIE